MVWEYAIAEFTFRFLHVPDIGPLCLGIVVPSDTLLLGNFSNVFMRHLHHTVTSLLLLEVCVDDQCVYVDQMALAVALLIPIVSAIAR